MGFLLLLDGEVLDWWIKGYGKKERFLKGFVIREDICKVGHVGKM